MSDDFSLDIAGVQAAKGDKELLNASYAGLRLVCQIGSAGKHAHCSGTVQPTRKACNMFKFAVRESAAAGSALRSTLKSADVSVTLAVHGLDADAVKELDAKGLDAMGLATVEGEAEASTDAATARLAARARLAERASASAASASMAAAA